MTNISVDEGSMEMVKEAVIDTNPPIQQEIKGGVGERRNSSIFCS